MSLNWRITARTFHGLRYVCQCVDASLLRTRVRVCVCVCVCATAISGVPQTHRYLSPIQLQWAHNNMCLIYLGRPSRR